MHLLREVHFFVPNRIKYVLYDTYYCMTGNKYCLIYYKCYVTDSNILRGIRKKIIVALCLTTKIG